MFMTLSEAINSDSNPVSNNSEEAMPAMLSSNSKSMLSNKRSASSATEADCYNMGAPPLRLTFRTARQPWDAVLLGHTLFVALPPHVLPEGSREALLGLLEAAEEQLNCLHVIVVFSSERSDRAMLMRTFMFLGFQVLSPTSPVIPTSLASGNVCMLYNIE
ncbi:hypothetical protein WA026_004859 [Henosepilachna vigintioctopunctata]|uniref:Ornithine decarboxylase antizyme n=1 Tax=Henosepilachna vigintioctopunctata TaxID=420089 RepID=A0AAW1UJX0_9CUCU